MTGHPASRGGAASPPRAASMRDLYVTIMIVRYFVSGSLHPERRFWPPGSLPILFHFVLAAYLYVLSRLARRPVDASA